MKLKSQENSTCFDIIEAAFSKDNIRSLLEYINFGTFDSIEIIKEVTHSFINKSILIKIPDDIRADSGNLLLNAKQGQPTVDQVYTAIYGLSAKCPIRIILFTDGYFLDDKFNPSADLDTVKCLVNNMNRFGLNIHLIQMVYDSTSSNCNFEILAQPTSLSKYSVKETPSKVKFTEAEFWEVYFWGYNNFIEATPFEFGFDSKSEFSQCFPIGDLELETKWTDEGAIISVVDTSAHNNQLEAIWDNNKSEIIDIFRGCCIELLICSGAVSKLTANLFNKPIDRFLTGLPWREKMHYAGLLWSKFMRFERFIEKALLNLKNNSEKNNNGQT